MNQTKESSKFGKFNVLNITQDQRNSQYLFDETSYVCILPFDRTKDGGIKSLYLLKFPNQSTGQTAHSLIIDEINPDTDRTTYDSVGRSLIEEAGVNLDDHGLNENHIFFLGEITLSSPISAQMHCYAIDLSHLENQPEFTRTLSKDHFIKDHSSIERVGFHQIVNGDFSDATVLAGSFLLISYFNQ